jgi:hypothetical protein
MVVFIIRSVSLNPEQLVSWYFHALGLSDVKIAGRTGTLHRSLQSKAGKGMGKAA